jgi:hypothetical protein
MTHKRYSLVSHPSPRPQDSASLSIPRHHLPQYPPKTSRALQSRDLQRVNIPSSSYPAARTEPRRRRRERTDDCFSQSHTVYDDTTIRTGMNQLSLLYISFFLLHNDDNYIDDSQGFNPGLLIILTANSTSRLGEGEGGSSTRVWAKYRGSWGCLRSSILM